MAFKFIVLCAFLATANAGVTLTSTSDNTYRSAGNLASVSTQSKSVETPYSSSSKSEIRVTNPSVYVTASPAVSYTSPAPVQYAKAVQQTYNYQAAAASPLSYTSSQYIPSQYHQSYALPAQSEHQQYYAAPVVAKTYQQYQPAAYQLAQPTQYSPYYAHQAHQVAQVAAAPVAPVYAAPMHHYAAPVVHQQPMVKFAYSPAAEVAHLTYSNANDHVSYSW